MLERILKLLNRHFTVKDGKVYLIENDKPVDHRQIESTIREIFGTPKYFNRYIIECWYISNGLEVYNHFWGKPWANNWEFEVTFPLAMRIASQTIGLDLVAVQPMSAPTGLLTYLDFRHDGDILPDIEHQEPPVAEDGDITPIRRRWETAGLLEGLTPNLRENLERLYENQARQLLRENEGMND